MSQQSHYDYPLIALRTDCGSAPEGELISKAGDKVLGKLLGLRIWPEQQDPQLRSVSPAMAFFYVEVENGHMMVPLEQIAGINLAG